MSAPPVLDDPAARVPVVITGLGVVSAIGTSREEFYAALDEGRSAIAEHPALAAEGIPLAAPIADLGAKRFFDPRALRRLARVSQIALLASREALIHAGLDERVGDAQDRGPYAADRFGVVFGTGLGSLRETWDFVQGYLKEGPEAASPLLFPGSVMNAAAGQVAIELSLRGANSTVNHRDASSLDALMLAVDLLAMGRADALVVGGVDEISPAQVFAYKHLGQLSRTGVRPYAGDRDGTAMGEGGAVWVLEREEDALRRGARVLARVAGFAASGADRPRVGWGGAWEGAARTIGAALDDARIAPGAIDLVCGGGSGMRVDGLEAKAVAAALGPAVAVSSVLGQTGEFMAAGALRVAQALYAMDRQRLPATVGAGVEDPEAPLPGLVREARAAAVRAVLLPSLAQGGSDSAAVLTK